MNQWSRNGVTPQEGRDENVATEIQRTPAPRPSTSTENAAFTRKLQKNLPERVLSPREDDVFIEDGIGNIIVTAPGIPTSTPEDASIPLSMPEDASIPRQSISSGNGIHLKQILKNFNFIYL